MDVEAVSNSRKSFMLIALVLVKDNTPHPRVLTLEEWKLATVRVVLSFKDVHEFSSDFVSDNRFMQYIKDLTFLKLVEKRKDSYLLTEPGKIYVHDRYISNGIFMKERTDPVED